MREVFTVTLVVLLVSSMFMGLAQLPHVAKAEENWLSGWNYRKSVVASTGVHVVTTHYDAGNDVLGHIYLGGACQTDFDDVRFTGPDGQTLISDVTIRTKLNSDHTEFKVPIGSSPIYVYYGNSDAAAHYAYEALGSGSFGDTDQLTQSYVVPAGGEISGIARTSPVTGYATSLEAVVSSTSGSTAQMALLLMRTCEEYVGDPHYDPSKTLFGRRIIAFTQTKTITDSSKHREVFTFDTPIPIFKGTQYGIALLAGEGTKVYQQAGGGSGSFKGTWDISGDFLLYREPSGYGTYALGRFLNYERVDGDEQNVLFRDNADYTRSRSMWHGHWEQYGAINAEPGQGIGGSYALNSTVWAPDDIGWGELAFLGAITDGNKRFWSGVVRLSALPGLGSHVELMAVLRYPDYDALNGFGVDKTEAGVQWRLSVLSGADVWSHTLFGEVKADTDYLVILSYETDGVDSRSEVWVTELSEPDLLLEASPSAALTTTDNGFGNMFFIGAADYPLGNVSPTSAFFDEMALTEDFPATFGPWESEASNSVTEIPLVGWEIDSRYTNTDYSLDSSASLLSLDLDATNTNSKATIKQAGAPALNLADYNYIDVTVTGTANAKILLRFFMTDGTSLDVVYWKDTATLNSINFALSAYSAKTLGSDVYIALMSSDESDANIDITQIALITTPPPPNIPLSGWTIVPSLTNAAYTLDSTASLLSLDLDAVDTNSKAAIKQAGAPALNLADYNYIDVTATGTTNAKILLRFFLDDGTSLDVIHWKNPTALDAVMFDLTPYSTRTLRGDAYIAIMSTDGLDANIDITQIALITTPPPPNIPLSGWTIVPSLTNAAYTLDSTASLLSLDLDAVDTNSKAAIKQAGAPVLKLADYSYINVAVTGTANAEVLLRFFLDDGSSFDVTYWKNPATLDTVMFDLTPYSTRTLRGDAYIALMSSTGLDASIEITEIAFIETT